MSTKIFSSRTDEEKLRIVEEIAQRDANISFGQFCGTTVVDYVYEIGKLPDLELPDQTKSGIETMIALSEKHGASKLSGMSDAEIKDLIASRYE